MSPAAKTKARPNTTIDDGAARRWFRKHYVTYEGGPPDWRATPFSRLVRVVDEFADEVEALRRAMHDPLAPGAAATIARIGDIIGTNSDSEGAGRIQYYDSEIEHYGEAIDWHLRGEPREEVEAERERIAALRARDEHMWRPASERTQEELEGLRHVHIEHSFRNVVDVVAREENFTQSMTCGHAVAESPPAYRKALVERLRRELLTDEATPTRTCRGCGKRSRWAERWQAEDLCYSPFCAEKVAKQAAPQSPKQKGKVRK